MKIEDHMIAEKEIAGETTSGEDVLGIKTHGGLFAFFLKKKAGGYKTLSMAPHKAIATWIAEQACESRIHWNTLEKSEPKSEEEVYDLLLKSLYHQNDVSFETEETGHYIAYNHKSGEMKLTNKKEVSELAKTEGTDWVVRNTSLSKPCTLACFWDKV